MDENGTDIQAFLRTIDDSTSTLKGHVKVSSSVQPDDFVIYTISATSEQTGYHQVSVAYVSGSVTSFSNGQDLVATFARTGDKGDTGNQGTQGLANQGVQGLQGLQGITRGLLSPRNPHHQQMLVTSGMIMMIQHCSSITIVIKMGMVINGLKLVLVLLVPKVFKVLRQLRVYKEHRVLKDYKVSKALKVVKVLKGLQGNQGTQGTQGAQGTQGRQGLQGLQGNQGTQGTLGRQGTQGTQGVQGRDGQNAGQGTQGVQGLTGTAAGGATGVDYNDNVKVRFGTSNDLEIYHDGSDSYIDDAGTGVLFIRSNDLRLGKYTGELGAQIIADGETRLHFDNSVKLQTKTGGIDVTGEVQCDSLDVDGAADITGNVTLHANLDLQDNDKILLGTGDDLQIYHSGSHSFIDDVGTGLKV